MGRRLDIIGNRNADCLSIGYGNADVSVELIPMDRTSGIHAETEVAAEGRNHGHIAHLDKSCIGMRQEGVIHIINPALAFDGAVALALLKFALTFSKQTGNIGIVQIINGKSGSFHMNHFLSFCCNNIIANIS